MRPSHNLPIPPEYTPFLDTMRTPIIYPSLPEYTRPLNIYMLHSRNPPYPHFKHIYAILPESTPPFQNISSFISNRAPRIYPIFTEYTPPPIFYNYMRRSQNQSHPPRIYPTLPIYPPKYATLPESTPPFRIILYPLLHHHMRYSHNLLLPLRIYPPLNIYLRLWPGTLPESIPPSQNSPGTPLNH